MQSVGFADEEMNASPSRHRACNRQAMRASLIALSVSHPAMNTLVISSCMQRSAPRVRVRRFLSAITAAFALGAATSASAVLVDFNSGSSDLTGNFTEFGETGGANFTYSNGAGVGGSGGLSVSGGLDSLVHKGALAGFSTGTTSIEVSVFYKARSASGGNAIASIATGLVTDPGVQLGGAAGTWFALHIQAQNSPGEQTAFQASFRGRADGVNLTGGGTSETFQVTHNNWYKFTTVYTYDAVAETFVGTVLIQDYGVNGLSATPSTVLSFTSSILVNVPLAEAAQLFAAVRTGAPTAAGANALDDFSVAVVPEPASAALVMAVAGFGGAMLARRRDRSGR